MVLTNSEIKKLIKNKKLKIEPFDEKSIGPASIDLTLDKTIRIFTHDGIIDVSEKTDYNNVTKQVNISKGYVLQPGQLVLGITKEKITLPENIAGLLQSRSRFARIGLMSHITAPFICPGVSNHQVLEIYNAGPNPLRLIPGEKICQLILIETKGKAKYNGIFKNQKL